MPRYDFKCTECGAKIEIEVERVDLKDKYRRKCPTCGKVRNFTKDWSAGMPAYHDRYSPMHPRAGRGRGGRGMASK
jgi:putative FmdB family regulatory protein